MYPHNPPPHMQHQAGYNPYSGYTAGQGQHQLSPTAAGVHSFEYGHHAPHQWDASTAMEPPATSSTSVAEGYRLEPGTYHPSPTMPVLFPQLYGSPVTAVEYNSDQSVVYAATTTSTTSASSSGAGRKSTAASSLLVAHTTHDGALYSSVAGHPQAPAKVLSRVYSAIYGNSRMDHHHAAAVTSEQQRRTIPNHAYRPPYGVGQSNLDSPHCHHRSCHTLVSLNDGYVASVSPAAVRLHTTGGLQVADGWYEGMVCGTPHPGHDSVVTHLTVGGVPHDNSNDGTYPRGKYRSQPMPLMCVDLYQGMRVVSTARVDLHKDTSSTKSVVCVSAVATNHTNGSIVAGFTDGTVRLFDARLRSLAVIPSRHAGGIVDVDVSADGTLVATSGYGSSVSLRAAAPLYAFPDPAVTVYDIRYLGRGGFPHPFSGTRGGPRFLRFLPPDENETSEGQKIAVVSGQTRGGVQIISTFQQETQESQSHAGTFIQPDLERNESIGALCISQGNLALGTSNGRILQYKMAGYKPSAPSAAKSIKGNLFTPGQSSHSPQVATINKPKSQELPMPSFEPEAPVVSIEASLLKSSRSDGHHPSVLSAYVLAAAPKVSVISAPPPNVPTFSSLQEKSLVTSTRLNISEKLSGAAVAAGDFLLTVDTGALNLSLLDDMRPASVRARKKNNLHTRPNPNKSLHASSVFAVVYQEGLNRRKGQKSRHRARGSSDDIMDTVIPERYRLQIRPPNRSAATFNHGEFNQTGMVPGWDYPPAMPNAFVSPVLLLLYTIPEIRSRAFQASLSEDFVKSKRILGELDCLFSRMFSLTRDAMLHQNKRVGGLACLGAWAPSSFVSCLCTMPEAEQLQILDGSPEAIHSSRRPEAFLRFILHQLEKELANEKLLDSIFGTSFVNVNEFISGSTDPAISSTRVLTVDLQYDSRNSGTSDEDTHLYFADVLQQSLDRKTRLRAWSQATKSYETIEQRKLATSLPKLLLLSCACAGRKEQEGMKFWRGKTPDEPWLPNMIEVEIGVAGQLTVKELKFDEQTKGWTESNTNGEASQLSPLVAKHLDLEIKPVKQRFRLEAVVSVVRDDLDPSSDPGDEEIAKHHVLHSRVSSSWRRELLQQQIRELEIYLDREPIAGVTDMATLGISGDRDILVERLQKAKCMLENDTVSLEDDAWILINGYVVSKSDDIDARAFGSRFKEPSVVVFRQVEAPGGFEQRFKCRPSRLSFDVMKTVSMSSGQQNGRHSAMMESDLPSADGLVAFDAEFVSVQDEEFQYDAGSKVVVREMRYDVARVSILRCPAKTTIFDNYVLPREPVTDFLTRFSGIVAQDLSPKESTQHLISSWAAYFKIRHLVERGCIFVGHGLRQDFWTMNLAVPPSQIIDTVEIYHKPAQRYISLRFLANFVLKRDMQQEVHDSAEDAIAAYELYKYALDMKGKGEFDTLLDDLYEHGQMSDWKVGVNDDG